MKFSIIVVCLNPGDKLFETIETIQSQTYKNYEVVVKDGMSTDGSVDKLLPDERIRVFKEKDKSIYDAMNQAVNGRLLFFLKLWRFVLFRYSVRRSGRFYRREKETR